MILSGVSLTTAMPDDMLVCPKCGARILLTKALTAPIEARLRVSIEKGVAERNAELEQRERGLKLRESRLEERITSGVESRLPKLTEQLRKEVGMGYERKLKEIQSELQSTTERAEKAEEQERRLRKSERNLEERAKTLDLEVARKVDEASKEIDARIRGEVAEAEQLKEQERQAKEDGLRKQIVDLQQKLDQGSQQAQGEALELELEDELTRGFPHDVIEPVPAGTRGADIVQRVYTPSGQACGVIVWETKRTKDWSDGWISKVQEDAAKMQGDASVLVSRVLPKGVRTFSFVGGVVVSSFACAIPVATLIRLRLLEVARQKRVDQTAPEIRDDLYRYLTSPDFVRRVESVVLPLVEMKQDLDSEVRAIQARWKKRRREIERAEMSIVGIYGDLRGIVGSSKLPEVSRLALPEPDPPALDHDEPVRDE